MAKGLGILLLLPVLGVLVVGHDKQYKSILLAYSAILVSSVIWKKEYKQIDSLTRIIWMAIGFILLFNNIKIIQYEIAPIFDIFSVCDSVID